MPTGRNFFVAGSRFTLGGLCSAAFFKRGFKRRHQIDHLSACGRGRGGNLFPGGLLMSGLDNPLPIGIVILGGLEFLMRQIIDQALGQVEFVLFRRFIDRAIEFVG